MHIEYKKNKILNLPEKYLTVGKGNEYSHICDASIAFYMNLQNKISIQTIKCKKKHS